MENPRACGILLHPTSLPGRYGIGELGSEARGFVDFLAKTRQRLWQVLPLGPTGYGDSPYQSFSAFAGNPLLVSFDKLVADGLLFPSDLNAVFPENEVDYGAVIDFKMPLLELSHARFAKQADPRERDHFQAFCAQHAAWLDDYALFMAVKQAHRGAQWREWDPPIARREPDALARWKKDRAQQIESRKFAQYLFFNQWASLRQACHDHGIRILGDVPIFVAHDSADVWAHPEVFRLAGDGSPAFVAGVPPDYFSATGQCWGNPLYRWDVLARSGYAWWIDRLRSTFSLVDLVRLDHFRGFEAFWEIPGKEATAVKGRWVKGPGAALLERLRDALGPLHVVAENLGFITPEVEALRERFGLPGMAVLQFAFGTGGTTPPLRPHSYSRNLVVYTGTHDNDTTVGWWKGSGDTTRTDEQAEAERELCRRYLGTDGTEINWVFIRAALASVADTAIVPLQDVLGLGSEARMNLPSRSSGNWRWRYRASEITPETEDRLRDLTEIYGRAERPTKERVVS
jgi:4-alpha-glucanotransferase